MFKVPFAALVFVSLATPALAFDCSKAATDVEKAICSDPQLKRLDDQMADAYASVKAASSTAERKMLVRSQKRWIAEREYCSGDETGMPACIAAKMKDRLSLLLGTPESGPGAPGKLVPVFLVQDGDATRWDIDLSLMRFADAKTPGETYLNRYTDDILGKATLGPHGEDSNGMTYAQEDNLALTYASPALLSVRHDNYVNEGGAHGNYGTGNLNIDLASGRLLTIKDIVDAAGAATLTERCTAEIEAERKKRVPDADDVPYDAKTRAATIAETVRNLSSWSIGQDEITVTFNPYAVGSYAEGIYTCTFPTKDVKALAIKGAVLP